VAWANFTWVDWTIVVFMVLAVLGGLAQGFFRSAASLGGLLLGLALAAWNYARVAALIKPLVRIESVADTIAFLLIALLVMGLVGVLGSFLAKAFQKIGLGCLDSLAGAIFGFIQGFLLVTLCIWVAVAFSPKAHWLTQSQLPRRFFGACHLSTHMSPAELAKRVREGLRTLEEESPEWMHPKHG
jgi:membrane protein required for colicin V production